MSFYTEFTALTNDEAKFKKLEDEIKARLPANLDKYVVIPKPVQMMSRLGVPTLGFQWVVLAPFISDAVDPKTKMPVRLSLPAQIYPDVAEELALDVAEALNTNRTQRRITESGLPLHDAIKAIKAHDDELDKRAHEIDKQLAEDEAKAAAQAAEEEVAEDEPQDGLDIEEALLSGRTPSGLLIG